jgi:hypothetical protein
MFKRFRAIGIFLAVALGTSCDRSSTELPVTPTIGTVATIQGTVMLAGLNIPLAGVVVSIGGVSLVTSTDGTYAVSGLKAGTAILTAERQGFQSFSQRVSLEGARTINIFLSPSDLLRYAGNWRGTWTTGAKSGGLIMTIITDTIADVMRVALDISGNIVADYDPPGETYVGTIGSDGTSVHFSQFSPVFGSISADLTSDRQIVGRVTNVPFTGISRFNFTGTITSTAIDVSYVITFTDGTSSTGVAALRR